MTNPRRSSAQRARRKQDLLLASQAVRLQALDAFDTLGGQVDAVAGWLLQLRALLNHPAAPLVGTLLGLAAVRLGLQRRQRRRPWLRWAWLAWRTWRSWRTLPSATPWPSPAPARR